MAITDAKAVLFSNDRLRVVANLLGKNYYRAKNLKNSWTANGSGQAALDLLRKDMRDAANELFNTLYPFAYMTEKIWFGVPINSLFPNDSTVVFDQGGTGQRTDVQGVTGAQANSLMTRVVEVQNWLLSATQSFTDSVRNSVSPLNTVILVTKDGPGTISLTDGGNFITRCSELITNYEASSNANLNTILAYANNPFLNNNGQ